MTDEENKPPLHPNSIRTDDRVDYVLALERQTLEAYERAIAEIGDRLEAAKEIPEELLMRMALALPTSSDLVREFVLGDLQLVPSANYVSNAVEDNLAKVKSELAALLPVSSSGTPLSQTIRERIRKEALEKREAGLSPELERFALANIDLYNSLSLLSPAVLAGLVMLFLQKEAEERDRAGKILAAWLSEHPEIHACLQQYCSHNLMQRMGMFSSLKQGKNHSNSTRFSF
jgi:hypothetical protein